MSTDVVVLRPAIISGAIHPSVPVIPDRREKLAFPVLNFLHRPKSEIMARTLLWTSGMEMSTFCGFMSR